MARAGTQLERHEIDVRRRLIDLCWKRSIDARNAINQLACLPPVTA
jgi:hypothetical protein